jgi:hypothetical protein
VSTSVATDAKAVCFDASMAERFDDATPDDLRTRLQERLDQAGQRRSG